MRICTPRSRRNFGIALAFGIAVRRVPGTLPIRGSPARTSSQARSAASSKSWRQPEAPASRLPAFPTPQWSACAGTRAVGSRGALRWSRATLRCLPSFRVCPEDQDDSVSHVDCQTPEHRPSIRRQRSERVEHELMRNGLALLEHETHVARRNPGRTATNLRHRTYDNASMGFIRAMGFLLTTGINGQRI